jgi:Rrf2 family transcriptional regulator, cysteine metabolism repressor
MKISTKGRYGIRAMLDLAISSPAGQVTVKSIAERQNISEGYLEQVFSSLRKGGLVKSIKGAQGGYVLGRSASSITVGDVLRQLEGDLSVVDENSSKDSESDVEYCISNNVWKRLNQSINNIVDQITLESLTLEYGKMSEHDSYASYI